MMETSQKISRSYEPNTVYIQEKKVLPYPYPYYVPTEPHRHCEVVSDNHHRYMTPNYLIPFVMLGTVTLFAVLALGLFILIDRARLTPVIRARMLENQSQLLWAEEMLRKATNYYNRLNGND